MLLGVPRPRPQRFPTLPANRPNPSGTDPLCIAHPSATQVGGSTPSSRATHLPSPRNRLTSADLIVNLDKIGAKIVDCIGFAKAVLPSHKTGATPSGLTNVVTIYQRHIMKPLQIRSEEPYVDPQLLGCGLW